MLLLFVLLLIPAAVHAAEIHLSFQALERMLSTQMFTDEGRRYVKGSRTDKCNYAWLEKPEVRSAEGRLLIKARFTGRSSLDILGRCIGMGDSFPLAITAVPWFDAGYIRLKNVKVTPESGAWGFYVSRVCAALGGSLERSFRYPLADEAKRGLEAQGSQGDYPRQLRKFNVTSVRVTEEALVFDVDFTVFVR